MKAGALFCIFVNGMKPKIVIERKREFANRLPYYIFLDGKKVGAVPYGRTVIFDAEPGDHMLKLKIDWIGSPAVSFRLAEDDVKTFVVSGFRMSNWILPIGFALAVVAIALCHLFDVHWFGLVGLPLGVVLIFYLTIGRDRYLRLETKGSTKDAAATR